MVDYPLLYKLIAAAACTYAGKDWEWQDFYPCANDDAIRDMAVEYMVEHYDELKKTSKSTMFSAFQAKSSTKFIDWKNNLVGKRPELESMYWKKGEWINTETRDGCYCMYHRSDSLDDVEFQKHYFDLIFTPYWDFIYDCITGHFDKTPHEMDPHIFYFLNNHHLRNIDEYKYKIGELIQYLGCLWIGGGNKREVKHREKSIFNILNRVGIKYEHNVPFMTWKDDMIKSGGESWWRPECCNFDEEYVDAYWERVTWYIKYFLTHTVKHTRDVFENSFYDWHPSPQDAMIRTIIGTNNYENYVKTHPVIVIVGMNDCAKRRMKLVLEYMEEKYKDSTFYNDFYKRLYYNEERGVIIYSHTDEAIEKVKEITNRI